MRKFITLSFVLFVAFISIQAQVIQVTIAKETFGTRAYGTNEHGPDIVLNGVDYDEVPNDYPGYPRHFDYDFIQEATDSGYPGFTATNGHIISGSSDSSVQINTYIGDPNSEFWPNASRGAMLHLTPSTSYSGSWDSVIFKDIDISKFNGAIDSISVNFGFQKRNGASWTWNDSIRGFGVEVSLDGGPWIALDTTVLPNPIADLWQYLEMKVPTSNDLSSVSTVDILIYSTKNQFAVEDLSLVGWGVGLPVLDDVQIVSDSGLTTYAYKDFDNMVKHYYETGDSILQGDTIMVPVIDSTGIMTFSVVVSPDTLLPDVIWSVEEGTGCARWDDVLGGLIAEGNGVVKVIAVAADGGGASDTVDITISGFTVPVESLAINGGAVISTAGGTLQLSAAITPHCANSQTVTWSIDESDLATVVDGLVTALADGSPTVTATLVDGDSTYTATKVINILNQTSVEDISSTNMKLYPNPVQNTLNISNAANVVKVEVLSLTGAVVMDKLNVNSDDVLQVNTSSLNNGMYLIKVHTSDNVYVSRFMK